MLLSGAGDGRALLRVYEKTGAGCVGWEINEDLVRTAREEAAKAGVPADKLEFVDQDLLEADLSACSVIFTWLQPWAVEMLVDKLASLIREKAARVVSYQWSITSLEKEFDVTVGRTNNMYLYTMRKLVGDF